MEKKHPEIEPPQWWTPIDLKKAAAEEEGAAQELAKEVPAKTTPLL